MRLSTKIQRGQPERELELIGGSFAHGLDSNDCSVRALGKEYRLVAGLIWSRRPSRNPKPRTLLGLIWAESRLASIPITR